MSEKNNTSPESKANRFKFIITSIIIFLVFIFLWLPHPDKEQPKYVWCSSNMKQLGLAFMIYFEDTGRYPTPEKWCDLLISKFKDSRNSNSSTNCFHCPEAERAECNYAMNPYCEPNSPHDTVLLFETKGGWNLLGGPELLTTENHSKKICNVLFNDGSVKRIKKDEIPNLKWNAEEKK